MNRLIIIGNGFDLAHGLKTTYKDFLCHYFLNVLKEIKIDYTYNDLLLSVKHKRGNRIQIKDSELSRDTAFSMIKNIIDHPEIQIIFHSEILKRSYKKIENLDWVDLEMIYFDELIKEYNQFKKSKNKDRLHQFFNQFEQLKEILFAYLQDENSSHMMNYEPLFESYYEKFTKGIYKKEEYIKGVFSEKGNSIYFLNFNYTNTISAYYTELRSNYSVTSNHIHGDLAKRFGTPVFGFGDVQDERFLELLKENDNEILQNSKGFEYLKESNYSDLKNYLNSDSYEVHIYGHSCGLSDKTLLNKVFEHENCFEIQQFYYKNKEGKDDFMDKSYNIARIFHNQTKWLDKVVAKKLCSSMPQSHSI